MTLHCPVRQLTEELIRRPSVTPDDAGCLTVIGTRLASAGFHLERMDQGGVANLWATHGDQGPMLCFAGHTDVVPTGDLAAWSSDPFTPTETADGELRGRGAADMKASLAAMVVAVEEFLASHPNPNGRIGFLLTSDEEGPATDGTVVVVDALAKRQAETGVAAIDYCVIGEPSSKEQLGDQIRVGRRGSLNARIEVHGIQGHVAYPELVDNPIHHLSRLITALTGIDWDQGAENAYFPPTSFQVSNLTAGTGATNVVPATAHCLCNWRFSTSTDQATIEHMTEQCIKDLGLSTSITWNLSGEPFLTEQGALTEAAVDVIAEETGASCDLSTGGGTSDGRFIAKLGCQLIELGPINRSIHKIDESVRLADLAPLKNCYLGLLQRLIG